MKTAYLPEEYALVLQEVAEIGEEDVRMLEESLSMSHGRLMHILQALRQKGLIRVSSASSEAWIALSSKGRRLVAYLWPELRFQVSLG